MSDIIDENDGSENEGIFDALRDDILRAHARIKKAKYMEYKQDASENLYPLMLSMLEVMDARMSATEGALAGLIEDEDIIHEPFAQAILGLANLGDALCAAIGDLAVDDVSKQRAKELIEAWRAQANLVRQGVADALVDTDDEEEEEDAAESDDEDTEATEGEEDR